MLVWVWFLFGRRLVAGVLLMGWFVTALVLARAGFFTELSLMFYPNIGLMFVPIIIGLGILRNSPAARRLIDNLPQHRLIAVQTMRLMGISFFNLYSAGLMPAEFALPSGGGDVFIGVTAPLVAGLLFLKKSYARRLAIIWNYVGLADLVLAIILGFFTSPTPYQLLALRNPNDLLFAYPMALIPVFAVPLSFLLHLFSLRALRL